MHASSWGGGTLDIRLHRTEPYRRDRRELPQRSRRRPSIFAVFAHEEWTCRSAECHSNCLRKVASCCWTSESSRRRVETSSSNWARRAAAFVVLSGFAGEGARATFGVAAS